MKAKNFITRKIKEYPSLYLKSDYEKSRLAVLSSTFCTLGNGLCLAETRNKKKGGYITDLDEKKRYNKRGDLVKYKYHLDYDHQEPIEEITDSFFIDAKSDSRYYFLRFQKQEFIPSIIRTSDCLLYEIYINDLFLQDDWIEEIIFFCEKHLEYYLGCKANKEKYEKLKLYYKDRVGKNFDSFIDGEIRLIESILTKYKK